MDQLTQTARQHAETILTANSGELGSLAATNAYQQVWAREYYQCRARLAL